MKDSDSEMTYFDTDMDFSSVNTLKITDVIGISRTDDFVLGVPMISFVPLVPSFLPTRVTVDRMCMILSLRSTSFHVRAHTSPIRKPAFKESRIPALTGVMTVVRCFSSFCWSSFDRICNSLFYSGG